jgi:hypothetical protein
MIAAHKCSKATQKSAVCMQVKEFGGAWVYDEMFLKFQAPGKAMQYIVEVRVSGRDLVDSMAEMRTWLDHQRIEPHGFRHRRDSARIMIHIDFNSEPDAIGFARAFGGRMVGAPTAILNETIEQLP